MMKGGFDKMTEQESYANFSTNIVKLRSVVRSYIEKHQYESALFWADKIVSLSKGEVQDIYWMAHILYMIGQYHRAALTITSNKIHKSYAAGRYLAARCHFQCKEYSEALDVLDKKDNPLLSCKVTAPSVEISNPDIPCDKIDSCIHLLRGKIYEALENRNLAAECFREALRADVFCFEAFECLVNHHMLTAQEEKELIESLPCSKQCSEDEMELVQFLYENKLKKYNRPTELLLPSSLEILQTNIDVKVNLAERHYYNCDFLDAFKITSKILSADPYNEACLPLHISILVELKRANDLFYLAHKLVDVYPIKAVSWFAVGCYYLLIGKNDPSRRYLSKSTSLDRVFGPSWLAFGHSFAAENEHDQAMAAYFTASQIMRGCHLPVLYIGLEYGLTNNAKLAERFFGQALSIAPEDPFVLHEMGTVAFQNGEFQQAENYFKQALEMVQSVTREVIADKWEPLFNNLGHICRKLKKYDESLEYHRKALILSPQNASTFSAMGYVCSLMGHCLEAVDYFHKALGLRRDDTFSTTMLGYAIEQLMVEIDPYENAIDVPEKPFPESLATLKVRDVILDSDEDCDKKISPDESQASPSIPNSSIEGEVSMGENSMALDTDMDDT